MSKRPTRQILAENIVRLRTENGWSQKVLADLMRLDRGHISKMESAQLAVTVDTVDKLAEAFQVAAAELLTKQESTTKNP